MKNFLLLTLLVFASITLAKGQNCGMAPPADCVLNCCPGCTVEICRYWEVFDPACNGTIVWDCQTVGPNETKCFPPLPPVGGDFCTPHLAPYYAVTITCPGEGSTNFNWNSGNLGYGGYYVGPNKEVFFNNWNLSDGKDHISIDCTK